MLVMTYSEARQNLAALLNKVLTDGEAIIKRSDGTSFKVIPQEDKTESPFSKVKPLKLNRKISRKELLEIMNDSRESDGNWFGKVINEKPAAYFGCFAKEK